MDIRTLVEDMNRTAKDNTWLTPEIATELSATVVSSLTKVPKPPSLRLSQMAPTCHKALWHSIHTPELALPLPARVQIMFTFGHILEAEMIALAKASGHDVRGEQDELDVDGVKGHRDCVIDGCIVDVKSCNGRVFEKIRSGLIERDDLFGYLDQLDGYAVGSLSDDLVTVKDRAYILAINKELGNIHLHEHYIRQQNIRERIAEYKRIVSLPSPPACTCGTVADGQSGNIRLDTKASYSPFRYVCFPHLRVFIYAGKAPVQLVKVVRRPYDVREKRYLPEVDREGNYVYH